MCLHYHDKTGTFKCKFCGHFLKISESYKFQHNILKIFLNDLYRNRDKGEGRSRSESPAHFSALLSSLYPIPLGDFHITPSISNNLSKM